MMLLDSLLRKGRRRRCFEFLEAVRPVASQVRKLCLSKYVY